MLGQVTTSSGATVVTLHGDLDLLTIEALRDVMSGAVAAGSEHTVVDLADVPFIDVMSLSVILAAADEVREQGRQLMVRSASTAVRRICALLNAEDVLAPALPLSRSALAASN
jgi:anti-sigma B factor antagonist